MNINHPINSNQMQVAVHQARSKISKALVELFEQTGWEPTDVSLQITKHTTNRHSMPVVDLILFDVDILIKAPNLIKWHKED